MTNETGSGMPSGRRDRRAQASADTTAALSRGNVAAAIAYGVQAAALAVVLIAAGARTPLPVVATFRADAATTVAPIATVDLGWALMTVLAGGAVAHAVAAVARSSRMERLILVGGWSQGSAIVVFLVAQLNGIAEVSSLVPLYAIAATAVCLQGIDPGPPVPTWRRPGAWAATVGIVPWGVIAFTQIGTGIAVGDPGLGVRIVTLLALAVAILGWITGWRRSSSARIADVVAMTAGVSVVVWAIVGFEVLGRA